VNAANTAVVTDSTACLPDEVAASLGIQSVSLYVTTDGEQRKEADIRPEEYGEFYERLRRSDQAATTSQPSIGDFLEVYEPLVAAGREVVSIHLSAGISGTYDSALQARQRLIDEDKGGERIHVYDSRTAAGGLALLCVTAAKAAAEGATGADARDAADRARASLQIWFLLDTLEYLRRGGRIGAAQALVGSALQVKPMLTLGEEITPVERVRTKRRAFERMIDYARERKDAGAHTWVVQHIQDHDSARHLVEQCREILGTDPVFVSEVGPVLGAHAGPGMLGFGALRDYDVPS
jgi:DegV family protein with EDD domain